MLTKLLKFKATARLFIPLYITLMLFALINRFLNPFNIIGSSSSFTFQILLSYITTFAYFALIVGVVVMTLIIMIQRFYKSLLGDEGYLMFTLPTETWKHVISKLLVAILWTVMSIMITFTSVIIISRIKLGDILIAPAEVIEVLGSLGFYMIPVVVVLSIAVSILMIYTAISLGHLLPRNKLVASFAMYALVYMFNQVITGIAILGFGYLFFENFFDSLTPPPANFPLFFSVGSVFLLISATVYFTVTTLLLKKKLNLE